MRGQLQRTHLSVVTGLGIGLAAASAIASDAKLRPPDAAPVSPCKLGAVQLPAPAVSSDLHSIAYQFQPTHRGTFVDSRPSASRAPYFDPTDPATRAVPPGALARVNWVTPHFLVGKSRPQSEDTTVVEKTTGVATVVQDGARLHIDDVLEAPDHTLLILGETVGATGEPGALLLFRGDNNRPPQTLTREIARTSWRARLGSTRRGRTAAAWVEGGAATKGRVSLRVAWIDEKGVARPAREADGVDLPGDYADLSVLTGANVELSADGDALAIAWRPLLPPSGKPADTGDQYHPPSVTFAASVRILVAAADRQTRLVSQHHTTVQPLSFTTGKGPWSLDPGGAWSFTLDGRAVFLWVDPPGMQLVAARPHDAAPTVLDSDSTRRLWVPRPGADGRTAVLFGYGRPTNVRALEVGCHADVPAKR